MIDARRPRSGIFTFFVGLALFGVLPHAKASDLPNVRHFPVTGPLQFVLHDDINLPFYSWPRTLLSYPVGFSASHVRAEQLQLVDDSTGKTVTMQLSDLQQAADGTLKFARICFFADLKPGKTASFSLTAAADHADAGPSLIKESTDNGVIEIDAGTLQVRIPQSRQFRAGEAIPAPIISINRGQGWLGDNHLISPKKKVTSITTQSLNSGPLFHTYSIRYDFDGGGIYTTIVKIVAGYTFVDFSEQIEGLLKADQAQVDMS